MTIRARQQVNYATRYPRFWLWYFVAAVVLTVTSSVYAIVKAFGGGSLFAGVGVGLQWLALWPLFGYIRQRQVNPRWLWRAVFYFSAVAVALVVAIVLQVSFSRTTLLPIAYVIPALVLNAPFLLALHQYVFRSPDIWQVLQPR
jgi:hypothetical protein